MQPSEADISAITQRTDAPGARPTKRKKILSNRMLRGLARTLVHLRPEKLGSVSEGYEGIFSMRAFGLPLKYDLGPRDSVGNLLLWCGARRFEPDTLPLYHRLARTANAILDIGANTGFYTMLACAANPKCHVIAWEPVPYLHSKLSKNIDLNGFAERCELRRTALSDRDGRAMLYVPGDSTMASLNSSFSGQATEPVEVEVATVDATVHPEFPVDLIKLDVESHEYSVLCGMRGLLARHHPFVIFECLPSTPPEPIEALLCELGYRIFKLSRSGHVEIKRMIPAEDDHNCNFLAATREFV